MMESARASLALLHHRPLLLHHDPGVRPGEVLDVRALGLGQSGGEEVDPGQLVCLTLHVGLGRLVVLPHDDDHERKQHSVGDAQDRVDEDSDVVVLLSAVRGHQALHHYQPHDRHEHRHEDRQDDVECGFLGRQPLSMYSSLSRPKIHPL
jgi:hypothetical protein